MDLGNYGANKTKINTWEKYHMDGKVLGYFTIDFHTVVIIQTIADNRVIILMNVFDYVMFDYI